MDHSSSEASREEMDCGRTELEYNICINNIIKQNRFNLDHGRYIENTGGNSDDKIFRLFVAMLMVIIIVIFLLVICLLYIIIKD